MERNDHDGRWVSEDGVAWRLVEPSEAFLQRRADAEAAEPPFPPLDATGALATLLVVEGVLDIDDAAHSVGTTGEHLVHEATAWGVG
jgi:hypothetical protein